MAEKMDGSGDNVIDAVSDGATGFFQRQRCDVARGAYPGKPFDEYAMNKPNRGVAIIVNNKKFIRGERTGSDVDRENLIQRFTELGFAVRVYEDLTAEEIRDLFKEVAGEDHGNNDCFICALMSCGGAGYICGVNNNDDDHHDDDDDENKIRIQELIGFFYGDKCRSLAGKPKIFFIQACGGEWIDSGAYVEDPGVCVEGSGVYVEGRECDGEVENVHLIPRLADCFVANSAFPGSFSFRNTKTGSWFVQAISTALKTYGQNEDLMSLLTEVNRLVASRDTKVRNKEGKEEIVKQMPFITSTLTKRVYFRPKK